MESREDATASIRAWDVREGGMDPLEQRQKHASQPA